MTEAWRIAWMVDEHTIGWVPHGWHTAIGLAADLHLSCLPIPRKPGLGIERNREPMKRYEQ